MSLSFQFNPLTGKLDLIDKGGSATPVTIDMVIADCNSNGCITNADILLNCNYQLLGGVEDC